MSDLPDAVADAGTTLVCRPSVDTAGSALCSDALSSAGADSTVVWVTFARPPSACVAAYPGDIAADDGPSLSVVAVGDAAMAADPSIAGVDVDTVSTPSDLTCLGITLSQVLSSSEDVVFCFDSLTVLLEHVDDETVYEFLHAVVGQLHAADASAHFHVDPTAHDRQSVDKLASLFETIVEGDEDEQTVRTRLFSQD